MVKESVSWRIYLMAGIITIVVFSIGIGIGYAISNQKYEMMTYDMEELQVQQKDIETELLLVNSIGTQSCGTLKYEIEKTAIQSASLGEMVTLYDKEIIKRPEFYSLKKNYMLNLIKFWSFWELFKKNCNSSVNTILYFYSIDSCSDCQAQGFVLSYFKEKNPDNVMTFAIDKDEDLYSLNLLKSMYNVSLAPTLVINNVKYEGLLDINQLRDVLV